MNIARTSRRTPPEATAAGEDAWRGPSEPAPFYAPSVSSELHLRAIGLLLAGYFILALASMVLSRTPGGVAAVWFSNALVIGVLWRRPGWSSPYLFAGVFLAVVGAKVATGSSLAISCVLAAANVLEIVLAVVLLQRLCPPSRRLPGPASFFLLLTATLGTAAIGATLAAGLAPLLEPAAFMQVWWAWWSSSAVGALVLLPLALSLSGAAWRELRSGIRKWELLGLTMALPPATLAALDGLDYPLVFLSLPLIVAAMRLNALAVALLAAVMVTTVIAMGLAGLLVQLPEGMAFLASSLQLSTALSALPAHFVALVIGRHRRDQEELRKSEARFRNAMDNSAIGMALVGLDGKWTRVNHAVCEMLGYSPAELQAMTFQAITHPDDLASDLNEVQRAIAGEIDSYRMEKRYVRKDGSIIWALLAVSVVRDHNSGVPLYFISQIEDIDQRKRAEQEQRLLSDALFEEKERLRTTLHSIGDAVVCTDADRSITFMNPIAERLTGWTMEEATGRPLAEVFVLVDEVTGAPAPCPVSECLRSLRPYYVNSDLTLVDRNGGGRSIQHSAAPIRRVSGDIIGSVLVFQDVTKARAMQRELAHSALHDALTGLPNRTALEQAIATASQQAHHGGRQFSLCFIDLDRFKVINDSAGHAAGDALLREVAKTIRASVRETDLTARLGGDEFALLLSDCSIENAEVIATALAQTIGSITFTWNGKAYAPGASIGITEIAGAIATSEVMSQADVACYAAKAAGRNRVSLYRPDESDAKRYHRDIQVASGIRSAIHDNRFRLFGQEILDLRQDGRRRPYYEILLRLQDESGRLILPAEFIPAAERYDLMGELDRWVVRTTLRDFGPRLRAAHDLSLAINLSANSLNDPSLWPFVQAELRASGLAPARLHFEITETALINNLSAASQFVFAARAADCSITLDDFGSGLSSFPYLRQFPVDQLKIDGNFVRQMRTSMADRTIVEAINDLGHRFGAVTIAEFVEDAETLALAREMGIDKAQGYFISHPAPFETIV